MTQKNKQSVRNAEVAETLNHIPTFEEVYAMAYVRKSIRSVIDQNIRQYPILAGNEDDLNQEILIHLNKEIHKFDPEKSSFNTFFRKLLYSGMCNARKTYFRKKRLSLHFAVSIHELDDADYNDPDTMLPNAMFLELCAHAENNVEKAMLCEDIREIIASCPEPCRTIALRIYAGQSIRSFADEIGIPEYTITRKYMRQLRNIFFQKNMGKS